MTDSTLTIGRLQATYLVPHQHPHPEQVKTQLDDAMRTRLPAVVAARLARFVHSDDPSIWFIRRLEIDLALEVGTPERAALAQWWGEQLATVIGRTLLRPPDGHNVVRFADRDAYVAQFVTDLVAGQAWDKWYYAQFESLRSLMPGQTVREAIVREDGRAAAILHHLAQRDRLESILSVLSEGDARRIYEACLAPAADGAPSRQSFARVIALWPRAGLRHDERWASAKNRLRLWLAAQQEPAQPPAQAFVIEHLLHFADLLGHLEQPGLFLQLVSRGQRAAAIALVRQGGQTTGLECVPVLEAAAAGDLAWLRQAAAVVAPAARESGPGDEDRAAQITLSHCGGLFLLLPTLLDLGLHQLLATHAPADVLAVWRYWLALKCVGRPLRPLSGRDPALLLAVGLDAPPDVETRARAVAEATPARLAAIWQGFIAILQRQRRADGRFLAVERSTLDGGATVLLLRDMRHDYWLYAGKDGPEHPQAALDALADLLGQPAGVVWQPEQPCPDEVAEYGRKAKAAAEALDHFRLPDLPAQVDLTFTLLAQAVLRTFARRLMGFAWSSPAYLYQNFLAGQSAIHGDGDRLRVEIPPAPLRLMLRMAGFDDADYAIPWLADRRVALTLKDEP